MDKVLEPGTRIGHYEVIRPIGYGGMGMVYEARREGARVALKALLRDPSAVSYEQRKRLIKRMRRESTVLAALTSPFIVRVSWRWTS